MIDDVHQAWAAWRKTVAKVLLGGPVAFGLFAAQTLADTEVITPSGSTFQASDGELGSGGFGNVLELRQNGVLAPIVLKIFHDGVLTQDNLAEVFPQLQAANLPYLLTPLAYGTFRVGAVRRFGFLMPRASGPLQDVVNLRRTFPISDAQWIGIADTLLSHLSAALVPLWRSGLSYNDLNARNVFVYFPNLPTESIAAFFIDPLLSLTSGTARFVLGDIDSVRKIAWRAPASVDTMDPVRLIDGKRGLIEADIYSLGSLLSEFLTGATIIQAAGSEEEVAKLHDLPTGSVDAKSSAWQDIDRRHAAGRLATDEALKRLAKKIKGDSAAAAQLTRLRKFLSAATHLDRGKRLNQLATLGWLPPESGPNLKPADVAGEFAEIADKHAKSLSAECERLTFAPWR